MIGTIQKILANLKKELDIAKNADLSPFNLQKIPSLKNLKADKYKKATINLHGMEVNIENPRLSTRFGKSESGVRWENTMLQHYGEFVGTLGADGDPVDTFLGYSCWDDHPKIFIVNQYFNGVFDEHKVMFGFPNKEIAKQSYLEQYHDKWEGFHSIKSIGLPAFKKWVYSDAAKVEF